MTRKHRKHGPRRPELRARRRRVADLFASGKTVAEIAAEFRVREAVVRSDLAALRAESAKRRPWADAAACTASFIEGAEAVLQKVRAAEHEATKGSPSHLNLLKLEWGMLVRFVEMLRNLPPGDGGAFDANVDLNKYRGGELVDQAKSIGIDTTGLERALALDGEDVGHGDDPAGAPGLENPA